MPLTRPVKERFTGTVSPIATGVGPGTVMFPAFAEVELPRKEREVRTRPVGIEPVHVYRVGTRDRISERHHLVRVAVGGLTYKVLRGKRTHQGPFPTE